MDTRVKEIVSRYEEPVIRRLLEEYFANNAAARIYLTIARELHWTATVDHLTIRCWSIERRAREFLALGYRDPGEVIEYPDQGWWAKVYRREGYPALFIDQAYDDERGKKSILPEWVATFGEAVLHHIAVRVPDIEAAKEAMEKKGVEFSGSIVGARKTRLRQIFTAAEVRKGRAYSVLELTERNNYEGFYPEQADSLMQASVKTKSESTR